MAFTWPDLTSAAHSRLWEHINNLAAAVAAAQPVDVTSSFTVIPPATSGFTTTIKAWRDGNVVTCQLLVNGTPAFAAWQTKAIVTVPAGLEPVLQAGGVMSFVGGFGVVLTTAGSMGIACDGGAKSFPAGNYNFTLSWVIV